MKKLLLILLFAYTCNPASAEYNNDVIILDVEPIQSVTQNNKPNIQNKSYNYTAKEKEQTNILYSDNKQTSQKNINFKKDKQYNNITVGTECNTTFSDEKASQNTSVYSKYKINDRFSVNSKYDTKVTEQMNNQMNGVLSIAPEMKINKKMSVSTVLSRNFGDKSNSEEVKLNIEPFKNDRVNLNVGAGEVEYDDGSPAHSRINFGTQFRF